MGLNEGDIRTSWEGILGRDEYHLRIADVRDSYPDRKSLVVPYPEIDLLDPALATDLLEHPDRCLSIGESVIRDFLPGDWEPGAKINLRITELPRDARVDVRDIRAKHLGRLIAVEGMVRKATVPKPRLTNALFRCAKCDTEMWVPQTGMLLKEPRACASEGCNGNTFILDERMSRYIDTQKIEVQENPEGLRGGAQPERMSGFIDDDIAGLVTPGNRITMNGVLRSVQKTERDKSTIFETFLDVLSVEFEQSDFSELEITDEDEAEILRMAADPDLTKKIVRSISPTIFGLDREKEAVALQLFGGSHILMDDGTSIRGDIHILLIGDPGVAKSQLLRYMSSLSPRGIYASGKSASAAGLCVSGDTELLMDEGKRARIGDLVESRIGDSPEEYRPGIWRAPVEGVRVMSMSEYGSLRLHPVAYVWKIKCPERLVRTTAGGASILLTPETKLQAMQGATFDWAEASSIRPGDRVNLFTDAMRLPAVDSVEWVDDVPEFVYDLTVEPSHSFVGSGFMVHNTAAAVKDDFGDGRWTLEAGALVLADKGLACIDELDKMSSQDRSSLHEAMESQKISVAKAGITATLQCRCSMLAAANPKYGRFDDSEKIATQIDLPPALMSRFDLMFVLTDKPNPQRDSDITDHILRVHRRGQARMMDAMGGEDAAVGEVLERTKDITPPYGVDILRKYVAYAKKNYIPQMTDEAMDIIKDDYLGIRKQGDDGSIPITARQLEAYIRLSEASARMHLRNRVTAEDAKRAVDLVRYYLGMIAKSGGGYDIDLAGAAVSNRDRKGLDVIRDLLNRFTPTGGITMEELKNQASVEGVAPSTVESVVNMLISQVEVSENKGKLRMV